MKRDKSSRRKPMQHQSEHPDQQYTEKESRDRNDQDIDKVQKLLLEGVLSSCREYTQGNSDQYDKKEGHSAEDQ